MASILAQKQSTAQAGRGSRLASINETGYSIPSTSTLGAKTATSYVNAAPRPATSSPTVTSSPRQSTSYSPPPSSSPAPSAAPVSTPSPVSSPVSAPTGGGGSVAQEIYDSSYYEAQQAQLEAALSQMEAQYGLSREQIMADQTEIGDRYRFMLSALQRSREEALLATQGGALQRGILRSGIYQGEEAKVNQEFASQEAALASDKSAKLNAIQKALGELEGSFATGVASESSAIVQQQIATMRQIADALALDNTFGTDGAGGAGAPGASGASAGLKGTGLAPGLANATRGFEGVDPEIAATWQNPGAVAAAQVEGRPMHYDSFTGKPLAYMMGGNRFMGLTEDGAPSGAVGTGYGDTNPIPVWDATGSQIIGSQGSLIGQGQGFMTGPMGGGGYTTGPQGLTPEQAILLALGKLTQGVGPNAKLTPNDAAFYQWQ